MKVIAIILTCHFVYGFFCRQLVNPAEFFYLGRKGFNQLCPGDAAYCGIRIIKADIIQLVQIAEHTDLREFSNSRKESKTQVAVGTFQYTVKSF